VNETIEMNYENQSRTQIIALAKIIALNCKDLPRVILSF